ncbi:hypothetical protein LCGC14_0380220 [marine sediment metagenome]|uniref:Uncharacterized protein n=1 Tax=marine sediment metagenome TaxID=412755 RepID=A0A0F9VPL7_9ZZZZ
MPISGVRLPNSTQQRTVQGLIENETQFIQSLKIFTDVGLGVTGGEISSLPGGSVNALQKSGDTMLGQLGRNFEIANIVSDILDVSKTNGATAPVLVVNGEGAVADDLATITPGGDVFFYQELWMQMVNEITIKETDNIVTPLGGDLVVPANSIVKFTFSTFISGWMVTSVSSSSSGDNLGDHLLRQNLDADGFQILDAEQITFVDAADVARGSIFGSAGGGGTLAINIPTNQNFLVQENGVDDRLQYAMGVNSFTISDVTPLFILTDTTGPTSFSIGKLAAETFLSDPTELAFQIALTDRMVLTNTLLNLTNVSIDMNGKEITGFTFLESNTANPADAEEIRLARVDKIAWNNQTDSANLTLGVTSTDVLTWFGATMGLDNSPNDSEFFFNAGAGKIKYVHASSDMLFNVGPAGSFEFRDNNYANLLLTIDANGNKITVPAGIELVVDSNTFTINALNTKIGNATTDNIGAYGISPVPQRSHVADATDLASAITAINATILRLEQLGWFANS